jgi:hypothetical protein
VLLLSATMCYYSISQPESSLLSFWREEIFPIPTSIVFYAYKAAGSSPWPDISPTRVGGLTIL